MVVVVVLRSQQPPNQPGVLQVEVEVVDGNVDDEELDGPLVRVGEGAADGVVASLVEEEDVVMVVLVVVMGSLQPNQPGVLQVEVVDDEVVEVVVVGPEVVDSSRQPLREFIVSIMHNDHLRPEEGRRDRCRRLTTNPESYTSPFSLRSVSYYSKS